MPDRLKFRLALDWDRFDKDSGKVRAQKGVEPGEQCAEDVQRHTSELG